MSLDNLNDDDENNNSSSRQYSSFDKDDFEEFLATTEPNWEVNNEAGTTEIVYEAFNVFPSWTGVTIRIYSTIDHRTGRVRGKGEDAIRTLIWDKNSQSLVGGRSKTLRIKTWKKNLNKKINSLLDSYNDIINTCPECGDLLLKKDGRYGEFLGCRAYPKCDYTAKPD